MIEGALARGVIMGSGLLERNKGERKEEKFAQRDFPLFPILTKLIIGGGQTWALEN